MITTQITITANALCFFTLPLSSSSPPPAPASRPSADILKPFRVFISNFAINDSITIALLTDLIQKPQSIGSDFSIYSWLLRIRLRMWINSTPIFGELIWIRMVGSVALRPLPFSKGQICPNQSSLRFFFLLSIACILFLSANEKKQNPFTFLSCY